MVNLRPADLAREHGLSTQAVRNYERREFLPAAERTASGYRVYTGVHAAALRSYLALVPAYGYATAGQIMQALNRGDLDDALTGIDRGHQQLLRDRGALAAVKEALSQLTGRITDDTHPAEEEPRSIGELAHRLSVVPATLRSWEAARILIPDRNPGTGYRIYRAADVRDAEIAHLLRRGGYPLAHIATVIGHIRGAGGADALSASLEAWSRRMTEQGLAMLEGAIHLGEYLRLLELTGLESQLSRSHPRSRR